MTLQKPSQAQLRDGVQVIARAADVLRRLAAEPRGLTLAQLSTRVSLPRTTTHRIVSALTREGFVRATPSGRLRIGPALVGLVLASRSDLRHEVGPYLERLSRDLRETVDLAVLDAGEVLFIDQHTSRRTLRIVSEIGARFPMHATANGKALLAALRPRSSTNSCPSASAPTPRTRSLTGPRSCANSTRSEPAASLTIARSIPTASPRWARPCGTQQAPWPRSRSSCQAPASAAASAR